MTHLQHAWLLDRLDARALMGGGGTGKEIVYLKCEAIGGPTRDAGMASSGFRVQVQRLRLTAAWPASAPAGGAAKLQITLPRLASSRSTGFGKGLLGSLRRRTAGEESSPGSTPDTSAAAAANSPFGGTGTQSPATQPAASAATAGMFRLCSLGLSA